MEKAAPDYEDNLLERAEARLPQPGQTTFSAVLNGMGNGVMLGVGTHAMLPLLYKAVTKHELNPATVKQGTVFATVIGGGIGIWYGLHEARAIERYRDSIGKEIIHLRDRVRNVEGAPAKTHAEKLAADREAGEAALERE